MTTKKIVIIVVSVIVVLGLAVVLFVGGIVGMVFYGIGNSDAANVSREFLKSNDKLKQEIGEGTAELHLKVIGERKEVDATVELIYRSGHPWRVTAAAYRNDAGEKVELLDPYESRKLVPKLAA